MRDICMYIYIYFIYRYDLVDLLVCSAVDSCIVLSVWAVWVIT